MTSQKTSDRQDFLTPSREASKGNCRGQFLPDTQDNGSDHVIDVFIWQLNDNALATDRTTTCSLLFFISNAKVFIGQSLEQQLNDISKSPRSAPIDQHYKKHYTRLHETHN